MAQSVKHTTSAQVMILRFVGLSPASGPVLTAQRLESASDSVSPSLSGPSPLAFCLSLSKINIKIPGVGEDMEELEISYTADGNVK